MRLCTFKNFILLLACLKIHSLFAHELSWAATPAHQQGVPVIEKSLKLADSYFFDGIQKPENAALESFKKGQAVLDDAEKTPALDNRQKAEIIARQARFFGQIGMMSGNREKVRLGKEIKSLADQSLALDSENALGNAVLGIWHFELARLSGVEKFFAHLLYGDVPEGSFETALKFLRIAIARDPSNIHYRLFCIKALLELDRKAEAQAQADEALKLPEIYVTDAADRRALKEIQKRF